MIKSQNFKQLKLEFKVLLFLVCVFGFLFLIFSFCQAAKLYLEPSQGQHQPGDIFIVEVRLDTEECINTVEGNLSFSQDILEAVDFSQGNSILTLWAIPPFIDQEAGQISFAGGIPGGYCGQMPRTFEKNNLLGKIIYKVREIASNQQAKVEFLNSSNVFLNDGQASLAKLSTGGGATFAILAKKIEAPKDKWQQEIEKDNIPPEEFSPKITEIPIVFKGRYILIFSTTDKQTGIDHYEIAEQKRIMLGILGKEKWEIAQSPYLLKGQGLRSIIKVKAVDKAGNERIETIIPEITWKDWLPWIMLLALIIYLIAKKIKKGYGEKHHYH